MQFKGNENQQLDIAHSQYLRCRIKTWLLVDVIAAIDAL